MVAMAMVVMGDMCVQSHPHTTTISNFYVGNCLYSLRLVVVVKHDCQCIMVIHRRKRTCRILPITDGGHCANYTCLLHN